MSQLLDGNLIDGGLVSITLVESSLSFADISPLASGDLRKISVES
jgi:hypothetical protein